MRLLHATTPRSIGRAPPALSYAFCLQLGMQEADTRSVWVHRYCSSRCAASTSSHQAPYRQWQSLGLSVGDEVNTWKLYYPTTTDSTDCSSGTAGATICVDIHLSPFLNSPAVQDEERRHIADASTAIFHRDVCQSTLRYCNICSETLLITVQRSGSRVHLFLFVVLGVATRCAARAASEAILHLLNVGETLIWGETAGVFLSIRVSYIRSS